MSGASTAPAPDAAKDLRVLALVSYGLYLAVFLSGFSVIVGVVLAYVKRSDARGTIYESHFENLITTFWAGLIAGVLVVGALLSGIFGLIVSLDRGYPEVALFWLPAAYFGCVILAVWYLYRTVKGLVRAIDAKPYR